MHSSTIPVHLPVKMIARRGVSGLERENTAAAFVAIFYRLSLLRSSQRTSSTPPSTQLRQTGKIRRARCIILEQ